MYIYIYGYMYVLYCIYVYIASSANVHIYIFSRFFIESLRYDTIETIHPLPIHGTDFLTRALSSSLICTDYCTTIFDVYAGLSEKTQRRQVCWPLMTWCVQAFGRDVFCVQCICFTVGFHFTCHEVCACVECDVCKCD